MLSALQHREYRIYWVGLLVSVIGVQVQSLAMGWLVLRLTDSPFWLGMVAFASAVPTIGLSLFGGVVADRVDRRRLLIVAQVLMMALMALLALLTTTNLISLPLLLVGAVIAGVIVAFDWPTRQALVPQLVGHGDLMNALALAAAAWQASRIVGPAIAGVLVGMAGEGACFAVMAVGVGVMGAAFCFMRIPFAPRASRSGGVWAELAEGMNFVRGNSLFSTVTFTTFLNSVFGMSYLYMMPVFARDIIGVGATGLGFLMGASGSGALLGTLVAANLGGFRRWGWLLLGGALAFGLSLIVFAWSQSYAFSLVVLGFSGGSASLYMTISNTIIQSRVPDELRGRVMSIYSLTWSMMPVGGMVSGTVATFYGAPFAVGLGGAVVACFAAGVAVLSSPVRTVASGTEGR